MLSVLINVNSRYLVVKVRNHFFKEQCILCVKRKNYSNRVVKSYVFIADTRRDKNTVAK